MKEAIMNQSPKTIDTFDAKALDSFQGKYRFLSNFWPAEIHYKGYTYVSTEHAYQAAKALNPEDHDLVATAKTPAQTKKLGRKIKVRPDWDQVKDQVMLDVVRLKFKIPELRDALLETGNAILIEGNTWGDTYWGVCGGVGQNKLGRILMQVREEIRNEKPPHLLSHMVSDD